MPTFRRKLNTSSRHISSPSKNTDPGDGSQSRFSALRRVDFPLPLGPIIPIITPDGTSRLTSFSIVCSLFVSDSFVSLCTWIFVAVPTASVGMPVPLSMSTRSRRRISSVIWSYRKFYFCY